MLQASGSDGCTLDTFTLGKDCVGSAEVDVGRGQVAQALMIADVVIVLDEGADLPCQACAGRPIASCLAEIGRCLLSRRSSFGGRPFPDHSFGARGPVPGAHTEVCGKMPAT